MFICDEIINKLEELSLTAQDAVAELEIYFKEIHYLLKDLDDL